MMPNVGTIVWAATCGLILVLLGMIRYTVSKGINNILTQLDKLWERMEVNQANYSDLKAEIKELKARCEERRAQCNQINH
jgi:peptidoglycan hydrolase CwlO-like protein